jgi:hypothetical protein
MSDSHIPWKRFWALREHNIFLDDEFLVDPEPADARGFGFNCGARTLADICSAACLVLLGEPGMGKTFCLKEEVEEARQEARKSGDFVVDVNLNSIQTDERLHKEVFECDEFAQWKQSDRRVFLFLDSLDEGRVNISNISQVLLRGFSEKLPLERLRLRIACRVGEWPVYLEEGLKNLWGEKDVGVYTLLPLREIDARTAAERHPVDPDLFLKKVKESRSTAFANRPLTLFALLGLFASGGVWPQRRWDLYEQNCRFLCGEQSLSRQASRATGDLSPDERLIIASRIAAVVVFCGRPIVQHPAAPGLGSSQNPTVGDFSGGTEIVKGIALSVTEESVTEVLEHTGLFASRGPQQLGFAHQTFAEFLAVRYLKRHNVSPEQVLGLIAHPAVRPPKIIPQLHEVAAWVAGAFPEVFNRIVGSDPQVLLGSDAILADPNNRAKLVERILRLAAKEQISDMDLSLRARYGNLSHDGIADQLHPYLENKNASFMALRMAIDIAEACNVKELQEDLAAIVLDPTEGLPTRVNACYALARVGDVQVWLRLKPLLKKDIAEDGDDRLKGVLLSCLWPECLTVKEVLDVLTPRKNKSFIGAYEFFLSHRFVSGLRPEDLPPALEWSQETKANTGSIPDSLADVADQVVQAAYSHLNEPAVLEALARSLVKRWEQYQGVPRATLIKAEHDRKRLVHALLAELPDPSRKSDSVFLQATEILPAADTLWMLEALCCETDALTRRKWAKLIRFNFDIRNAEQIDAILEGSQDIPELMTEFSKLIEPLPVDSPEAKRMRRLLDSSREMKKEPDAPIGSLAQKQVREWLDSFESGELDAWWKLNLDLTVGSNDSHYHQEREFETNLALLPGWREADDETRLRILNAARVYVARADSRPDEWLGTNTFHRPDLAGYRALRLLYERGTPEDRILPAETWEKWAPAIIGSPSFSSTKGEEEVHQEIVKVAYSSAPDQILWALDILISRENEAGDRIFVIRKMARCWDERVSAAVLKKAQEIEMNPSCMGDLLASLVEHECKEGNAFARSFLRLPLPSDEPGRARALKAAEALFLGAHDVGWDVIWPVIQEDAKFSTHFLASIAHSRGCGEKRGLNGLTENQVADLYIWLENHFPVAEDSEDPSGIATWSTPRDSVRHFRDDVLRHLQARGTPAALEELRRIQEALPHLDWLKWTQLRAQAVMLEKTWIPPAPAELLGLFEDRSCRLVESGMQLLEVMVESLDRLQARLKGHTPPILAYWDELPGGSYRPKRETVLADLVKDYFNADIVNRGIIVNREVEVRRPKQVGVGERTDIHVDAVIRAAPSFPEQYERLTAVIEVKGCWNRDRDTAMETQLRGKYLCEASAKHGLYLVCWFNCPKWDPSDSRKPPKIGIEEARNQLEVQAARLSDSDFTVRSYVLDLSLP